MKLIYFILGPNILISEIRQNNTILLIFYQNKPILTSFNQN